MKVRKAVIAAAGWGTRFLPITKAQPKEMLPLVNKPLIQYSVDVLSCSLDAVKRYEHLTRGAFEQGL